MSLSTSADDLQTHFAVNTTAPLMLFQALWPLMQASQSPKFFPISSSAHNNPCYFDMEETVDFLKKMYPDDSMANIALKLSASNILL